LLGFGHVGSSHGSVIQANQDTTKWQRGETACEKRAGVASAFE
jgi:hypothetical protein